MNWNDIWDIAKGAIIPLVGVITAFFKQKIDKMEEDIEDSEKKFTELEKKVVYVESTYATKAELTQMLNQINSTLMNNNSTLEQKIEKIMDLKNAPIKMMLEEVYKRQSKDN